MVLNHGTGVRFPVPLPHFRVPAEASDVDIQEVKSFRRPAKDSQDNGRLEIVRVIVTPSVATKKANVRLPVDVRKAEPYNGSKMAGGAAKPNAQLLRDNHAFPLFSDEAQDLEVAMSCG